MSTVESLNTFTQLAPVRVVAASNQSGTYNNGPLNNGVGATFTYATGALTIDSVAVVLGDFVLLAGQSSAYQNGIYQCTTQGATGVAAVLTRRGDFQCIEQMKTGHFVPVSAGTTYGGSVWQVVEPAPADVGAPASGTANNINFATITATGSALYLQAASNLSDVANATTARTNLNLGVDVINKASVTLTAAQFNGMYGAPVQLVAAPGANKLIVVDKIALKMTFVSAQYAAGGAVVAQYDNTVHAGGTAATDTEQASDFTGAAASTTFFLKGLSGNGSQATFSSSVNKGIYLSNASAAFTTGDSTFVVDIWYKVVATA